MATFGTGQLKNLPRNIANGMVKDVVQGSTVAALSARRPQRFGNEDIITFTGRPKAEFVGEGQAKSSTTGEFDFVTSTPKKTQVTMRFNEEVQWADQDYQLGVLDTLSEAGAEALARALDLGLYHRINPLTGTEIDGWQNYLNAADRRVEITPATAKAPELIVEAAIGLLVANGHPTPVNGLALHPSLAWGLSTERFADGRKKYPELGLGIDLGSYNGLRSSTSDTVAGGDEALPALTEARAGPRDRGRLRERHPVGRPARNPDRTDQVRRSRRSGRPQAAQPDRSTSGNRLRLVRLHRPLRGHRRRRGLIDADPTH